jgi:predicted lipid-binding transport protein (Tim44 family)
MGPIFRWAGIASLCTPLAAGLNAIAAEDPGFDVNNFIADACDNYETIITNYSKGSGESLRKLTSREVYEECAASNRAREAEGETVEVRFVSIDEASITTAEVRERTARITMRFASQLVSVSRDRSGAIFHGSSNEVTRMVQAVTFVRELSSTDTDWRVDAIKFTT